MRSIVLLVSAAVVGGWIIGVAAAVALIAYGGDHVAPV